MSKGGAGLLGFVAGLVAGYCIVLFGWVGYTVLFDVHDFEGAMIMGFAFFFAPVGGVVLGLIFAAHFARRAGQGAGGSG